VAFPLEYGASKVHRVQKSLQNTAFFVNLMFSWVRLIGETEPLASMTRWMLGAVATSTVDSVCEAAAHPHGSIARGRTDRMDP
jgi:hypothetical protein